VIEITRRGEIKNEDTWNKMHAERLNGTVNKTTETWRNYVLQIIGNIIHRGIVAHQIQRTTQKEKARPNLRIRKRPSVLIFEVEEATD
jgi:hypothetical protein